MRWLWLLGAVFLIHSALFAEEAKEKLAPKANAFFRGFSSYGLKIECEAIEKTHPVRKELLTDSAKKSAGLQCTKAGFAEADCHLTKGNLVFLPESSREFPGSCVGWALVAGTTENGVYEN